MNVKTRYSYDPDVSTNNLYDKYPTIDDDGSDTQGLEHPRLNKHDPISRNKKKRETETVL